MTEAAERKLVTIVDITDEDRHNYSDMHKDAYGYRPRYPPTDDDIVYLLNAWDSIMDVQHEEAKARLEYLREEHGIQFETEMDYYIWREKKDQKEWEQRQVEKVEATALKAKLSDPSSPVMAIELWDYGDEHLLVGV